MKMKRFASLFLAGALTLAACAPEPQEEVVMVVETTMGTVEFKLYNETPLHRDNFLKLADAHYFDSLLFHRVIDNFVIQGGDPNSRYAQPGEMLGDGEPDWRVPAEFRLDKGIFHRKWTVNAAREGDDTNPDRESCASQFCFMMGSPMSDEQLDRAQARLDAATDGQVKLTPEMRQAYKETGGSPHLDGQYTVFGEVVSGFDVLEAIQKVATDPNDRPVEDVRMLRVYRKTEAAPEKPVFEKLGDIGTVSTPAVMDYDEAADIYTISAAGLNLWADTDACGLLWMKVDGDFEITGDIDFAGEGVNPHRKIGFMIREDLSPNGRYVDIAVHGDGLTSLQYRPEPFAQTFESGSVEGKAPTTIALKRRGGLVMTRSGKGVLPGVNDACVAIDLPETCYVGLFVCSHEEDVVETGHFRNVKIQKLL